MHSFAALAITASLAAEPLAAGEELTVIPAARAVAPDNATNVPTNASIWIITSLLRPDTEIPVDVGGAQLFAPTEIVADSGGEQLLRATIAPLPAGAAVTYTIPDDFRELVHRFEVGDADDNTAPAAPLLTVTLERINDDLIGLRSHVEVVISTDLVEGGVAALVITEDADPTAPRVFAIGDGLQPSRRFHNGEPTLCMSAVAIDFAGNESPPSPRTCVDTEQELSGCASAGSGAGAIALLALCALSVARSGRRRSVF